MGKRHKHSRNKLVNKLKYESFKRTYLVPSLHQIKDCAVKANNKAFIYNSELEFLGKCILDSPNIETGGQLFGYWTASGAPVVVYAIGPGPNANHQVAFFNQDVNYLEQVGKMLVSKFGLMHIGEWHSHHQLGLDRPSGHDANTMQSTIDRRHLKRFLLCIGNCRSNKYSIKPYNFLEGHSSFVNSSWVIKGDESPLREMIDTELSRIDFSNIQPNSLSEQKDIKETWFEKKENRVQLKSMLDYLSAIPTSKAVNARLGGNIVQIVASFDDRNELISFPIDFPNSPISVEITSSDGTCRNIVASLDKYNKDNNVYKAFIEQYNSIKI